MGKLLDRINELSKKNKTIGLTEEEIAEREVLRKQYMDNFRSNFRQQMDNIKWAEDEDGNKIQH
ncbi:MAG: DUF896 domain-containing protein [Candidatus Pristimantibacillus sp.]